MPKGAKKFPKKGKKIHKKVYESAKNCGGGKIQKDPANAKKCQKGPKSTKKLKRKQKKVPQSSKEFYKDAKMT